MLFNSKLPYIAGLLLFVSCDGRQIALELELPTVEPKIVLNTILINGDYTSVSVERTLLINDGSHTDASINNAEVLLWEDGNVLQVLQFKSDTFRVYDLGFNGDTVRSVILQIKSRYHSSEKLNLISGASYHITATADGFPGVISEKVLFKDETTIVDFSASPSERNDLDVLIFPEIRILIKNASEEEQEINIDYYPWRNDIDDLEFPTLDLRAVTGFGYNSNDALEDEVLEIHSDIQVEEFFATNDTDCMSGCYFSPEGIRIIITTTGEELREYRKSLSSSEYLGGFSPPNTYLKTNINGGYGFFAIIEKDTLVIEE